MVKGSNNNVSGPKRRLDLDDDTNKTESKKEEVGKRQLVDNPYKKPKSNTSTVVDASIITPETGIEKFFTKDKKDDGKKKVPPAAKRKLVSPSRGVEEQQQSDTRSGKEELYYHSDNSSEGEVPKETNPDHIHESIDYHHRGEVTLSTGQMGAYIFIRNHFLIPRNIELDPDFGPWSGICFEERVLRAYTLGQLLPKKPKKGDDGAMLKVCTYCGTEGHKRDGCLKLI
jgi:hypothetical protein